MKVTPSSELLYSWEHPDIARAACLIMLKLVGGGVPDHDDVPKTLRAVKADPLIALR